ncbi:Sec-independent protein translocase subunit TatA [Streptomyces sp. NPDC059443]|uniref:Sec-independent protein translocase subunit TatA n=1 Tax=unclassified Streptomyces TaxID=2593676 RepID=UPI00368AB4DE
MLRNGLEPWHVAIVVIVCLMLFGSKKLPEMARGLGKSARILKAEARALREETDTTAPAAPAQAAPAQATAQAPTPVQVHVPTPMTTEH